MKKILISLLFACSVLFAVPAEARDIPVSFTCDELSDASYLFNSAKKVSTAQMGVLFKAKLDDGSCMVYAGGTIAIKAYLDAVVEEATDFSGQHMYLLAVERYLLDNSIQPTVVYTISFSDDKDL